MRGLHCYPGAAACVQLWAKLSGVFGSAPAGLASVDTLEVLDVD